MGQRISVKQAIELLLATERALKEEPDNEYLQHARYCLWVPLHNLANRLRREWRIEQGK
jgi:hypothetical protein